MKMFCFKIENNKVEPFSYNDFICAYRDKNKGEEKWQEIKERVENRPKIYKEAKYISQNHNNIIYVFGFGLSQKLLEEMVEVENNSKKDVEFYLLHKNNVVAEIIIHNNETIEEDGKIVDYEDLPMLFKSNGNKETIKKTLLNYWLKNRSMRLDRLHYDRLLKMLKSSKDRFEEFNEKSLVIRTYALSLNDCYWIKQKDNDVSWEEVNFFENKFDVAINKLYVDTLKEHQVYNFVGTPNNTTAGQLRKVWEINDKNERILYKKSDGVLTDVINEKIVSDFLDICEIDHIKYWLEEKYGGLCSVCKNACDIDNEFICFNDLVGIKYDNKLSMKDNVVKELKGIKKLNDGIEFIKSFNQMILIDILFGNIDRHWGNFGMLRNVKTNRIKMMPIFDNGFSMCGGELDRYMDEFLTDELMQTSKIDGRLLEEIFDYIDKKEGLEIILNNLDKSIEIMEREYKKYNISEKRIEVIKQYLQNNIDKIRKWQKRM